MNPRPRSYCPRPIGRGAAWLLLIAAVLVVLTACSLRRPEAAPTRAPRPEATSTPVGEPAKRPGGALLAPPPAVTPVPRSSEELAALSTEEQLALVVAPTRDLRDLALRLNPTVGNIPLAAVEAPPVYQVGDRLDFWVHDLEANRNFQISAELVHKTDVAYAWVEVGKPADRPAIVDAIDHFSRQSYPAVTAFFGSEWKPGVDNDPRLHVLHATGLGSGIAGYYSSADQYSRLAKSFSNEKEMFYINLGWLNSSRNYPYYETVLAHEFQHMIHWYRDRNEETWVNEGLSELAPVVAGYDAGMSFAGDFAAAPDTQLNTWGEDQGNNGVHYGSAFLMMAYFAQRFGPDLTRALVAHPANGIRGFDAVLAGSGAGMTFNDLFADWVVANYAEDPNALGLDGVFGYRDLEQPPPVLAATHDAYPTAAQAATVGNYAADYILLEGSGDLSVHFRGQTGARLAELPPGTGRYAWWSNRGDDHNTRLTRRFDLSGVGAGMPVQMAATIWYDLENDYDYGYVLASRDGEQWEFLTGARMTPDTAEDNAFGPAYTGESGGDTPGWITEQYDLSAYAGDDLWLRFEYVTDDAVNTRGWFIDSVEIPALGYAADFEGSTGGWESEGWILTDNSLPQHWLVQLLHLEDNRLTGVERIPVDAQGQASAGIAGPGQGRSAVLAVSGLTPVTTEPATYEYWIDTR